MRPVVDSSVHSRSCKSERAIAAQVQGNGELRVLGVLLTNPRSRGYLNIKVKWYFVTSPGVVEWSGPLRSPGLKLPKEVGSL